MGYNFKRLQTCKDFDKMSKMGKFETADVLRVSFDGDLCMETVGGARPICLPYTQARSFAFRIEEVKLGGEF